MINQIIIYFVYYTSISQKSKLDVYTTIALNNMHIK